MEASQTKSGTKVGIAIITSSCCFPGVAPFEEKTKSIVEQAMAETDVDAEVRELPVSSYFNSIPKEVVPRLLADYNQGKISAPPILIDGKAVFYGVPEIGEMKAALLKAAAFRKTKEEHVLGKETE